MIEWIDVKDQPFPKDGGNYLALFIGQFCIMTFCSLDDEEERYYFCRMPNTYDKTSSISEKDFEERHKGKLTHWAHLKYPDEY